MRLRIIRDIIDKEIPSLDLKVNPRNTNPKTYQLTNHNVVKGAIQRLNELDLFNEIIETLKQQSFYSHTDSTIIVNAAEYRVLSQKIPELKKVAQGISNSISQTIDPKEENVVSIKIPRPNNFDDLETISGTLHKIFNQTLTIKGISGGIRIKNFDSGSYWIDIVASSKEIVGIIAGLAWSGVVVYKKLQEGRLLEQKVKEMKISNKAIQEIVDRNSEEVSTIADQEANHLYKTLFKGKDNEEIERIKLALRELAKLFAQGAEIHPSLNADNKITESFPDFDRLENVISKIKKIENKK